MRWLGLLPAWLTLTVLASPSLPLVGKIILGCVLVTSAWAPADGFLLAAGLAPLGALLATVFDLGPLRFTEAILVAFLAGWLARGAAGRGDGPALPRFASQSGWLFAWLIAASVVGLGWRALHSGIALQPIVSDLALRYFTATDPIGAIESAKLLEGLALIAATLALFRARPSLAVDLPVVLTASAVTATCASVMVGRGLGPASLLQEYARTGYRLAAHVPDVNAAGSYFVLILCLSLGMGMRARGSARLAWIASSGVIAVGLWLSESKTAFAAAGTVVALAAVWAWSYTWRPALRIAAVAVFAVGLVGIGAASVARLERDPTYRGAGMRTEFAATSLRMLRARPLFGIGVGRYYEESALFLSPMLAWTYGRENAHNNFLQIAGETGIVGFALFALLMVGGLTAPARALKRMPRDWRLMGAFAGVLGFLGTCLAGHPLLVREVATPFWMAFGLLAGLGSSTLLTNPLEHRQSAPTLAAFPYAAVLVAALIAVSIPLRRFQAPLSPAAAQDVDGFYQWETGTDGVKFRWTGEYASLFVPAAVTRVGIPVRVPKEGASYAARGIEIRVAGAPQGRFELGDNWTDVMLTLPEATPPATFRRIDLMLARTWQPALVIPGSAEMRSVGAQVGELHLLRFPQDH